MRANFGFGTLVGSHCGRHAAPQPSPGGPIASAFPQQRARCKPEPRFGFAVEGSGQLRVVVDRLLTGGLQRARCLLFECCLRRVPEADGHPVVGIHQADRDREIDQIIFLED